MIVNTAKGVLDTNSLDDRTSVIAEKVNELMQLCKQYGLPFIAHVAAKGGKSIAAFWVSPEESIADLVNLVRLTEGTWESLLPDMTCKLELTPREEDHG